MYLDRQPGAAPSLTVTSLAPDTQMAAATPPAPTTAAAAAPTTAAEVSIPPRGELAANVASWVKPYVAGPLTPEELDQYWRAGYVVKRDLLPVSMLDGPRAALSRAVDKIARDLHAAGLISDLAEGEAFEHRMIAIEKQYPSASVLLHKQGVLPPEVAALWSSEILLACARQFLGVDTDIAAHPVWNIRVKTPGQEQAVRRPQRDVRAQVGAGCAMCPSSLSLCVPCADRAMAPRHWVCVFLPAAWVEWSS